MGRLTSRAVVVSGAASGIGAVAARMVVRECFMVVALDVTGAVEKITGEIRESGGKAYPLTGDVIDECTWHEAVAVAEQTCGGIDVSISKAYTLTVKPLRNSVYAPRGRGGRDATGAGADPGVGPRQRARSRVEHPVDGGWSAAKDAARRIADEGTL